MALEMLNWLKTVSSAVETWSPYTDKDKEGTFVDIYTGEAMQDDLFQDNQPNGGTSENCGWYDKEGKIWDQPCKEDKFMSPCVCRFHEPPILSLRGLCTDSFLDTKYTLHQGSLLGFYGLSTTKIRYDKDEGKWQASIIRKPTKAFSKVTPGHSMLLGVQTWNISKDSLKCNGGEPYSTRLKMSGCEEGQFTCNDGQCIDMMLRCD